MGAYRLLSEAAAEEGDSEKRDLLMELADLFTPHRREAWQRSGVINPAGHLIAARP